MRWVCLCGFALSLPSLASNGPSAVALCASFFRPGEKATAEAVLGPMEGLPLYEADLKVDPVTREGQGTLDLAYPARHHPLSQLYLRLTPDAFRPNAVRIDRVEYGGTPLPVEHVHEGLFRVRLKATVPKGGEAKLRIRFSFQVPRRSPSSPMAALSLGRHRNDHGAFSADSRFVSLVGVLPQVPPMEANGRPSAGPSGVGDLALYEPGNYLVSVRVPKGYRVFAVGRALGEVPDRAGQTRFTFAAAAVRDFPLFVATGYAHARAHVGSLTVESDFLESDRAKGKEVLRIATSAVSELEKRLGPLPGKTFRVVEAPLTGGAGGMEFPGLVTIGSALYGKRLDPFSMLGMSGLGSSPFLQMPNMSHMLGHLLELVVAHEVAHQWFAGLVGSDPVNEPVVDESLAQYVAVLYLGWTDGPEVAHQVEEKQLVLPYQMYRMMGGHDGAADRPTSDFPSEMAYAALVYGKAPLLFRADRALLGKDAFIQGLATYVKRYRYRWACGDCFTQVLEELHPAQAGTLEGLRRRWWLEAHGDEDLGQADLGAMVKQMTGVSVDPQSQALLKQLLPGLMNGGP